MRLFVAINFPLSIRQTLWDGMQPLRTAGYPVRWVGVDEIHVTIKFLGDVAGDRVGDLADVLQGAASQSRRFELPMRGAGAFPNPKRPRVVWIGCEAVPPLELLQHSVERSMQRLGFPLDGRPFRPHVTLGRARRDARPRDFHGFDRDLDEVDVEAVAEVSAVDLMESRLGAGADGGSRYVRRADGALSL